MAQLDRYKDKERRRAYNREYAKRPEVRAKATQRMAKWREANRERYNALTKASERRRAGLPTPTRPEPTHCELCHKPPRGKHRCLHLDHCHATGAFRGWLCFDCNTSIGKLGDNVAGLKAAIQYLERGLS